MSLYYCSIARGTVILCTHQDEQGRFDDVVKSMLPNIPTKTNAKTSYAAKSHMFHVQVDNGLIFICATDQDSGKTRPYAFLAQLASELSRAGLVSRAHFAMENELQDEFSQTMASEMGRYSTSSGGGGNVSVLQAQVEDVKGVMTQNIEKVLQRGENLEDLMDKTNDLEAHAMTFQKTARKVHRKMWWKNTKMMLILICVVVVVLLTIILIILFSTGVLPAGGDSPTPTTTTIATP